MIACRKTCFVVKVSEDEVGESDLGLCQSNQKILSALSPDFRFESSATESLLISDASIHMGFNVLKMLRRSAPYG